MAAASLKTEMTSSSHVFPDRDCIKIDLLKCSPTIGLSFRSLVIFYIVLLVVNKAGEIGTRLGGGG